MPTRNVNLTDHFDQFIEMGIASGRFTNASDVVREGLRLLELRDREGEARMDWLRGAARQGFDEAESGDCLTLDTGTELENFVAQLGREAISELARERLIA